MSKDLDDFASLMVDEVIATTKAQLASGKGLSLEDQGHLLAQLIQDRDRAERLRREIARLRKPGSPA